MKIGDLARTTGTPAQTIRYYEREGLLPLAPRSEGNYRVYGEGHVQRLGFIRNCRGLDMALDEIRVLLRSKDAPQESCDEINVLIDEHIDHVASRIKGLRQLEKQLRELRSQCRGERPSDQCAILAELSHVATERNHPPKKRRNHITGAHGTIR